MVTSLKQLHSGSRDKCLLCDKSKRVGNTSVDCADSLRALAYAVSKCPNGLWDNSAPVKYEPEKPIPPINEIISVCFGKHLEWPVEVWEQFTKYPLVDGKFQIPRTLFQSVVHRHINNDE